MRIWLRFCGMFSLCTLLNHSKCCQSAPRLALSRPIVSGSGRGRGSGSGTLCKLLDIRYPGAERGFEYTPIWHTRLTICHMPYAISMYHTPHILTNNSLALSYRHSTSPLLKGSIVLSDKLSAPPVSRIRPSNEYRLNPEAIAVASQFNSLLPPDRSQA